MANPTADRRFATEWAAVDIRVHRQGDRYQLEIRADIEGRHEHHRIDLPEDDARDLRDLWEELA